MTTETRAWLECGTLCFWLPWEALVSDNRKYKFRFVLSDQYREAKQMTALMAHVAAQAVGWVLSPGPLAYHVTVREPNRVRRDLNFAKAFGDGVTASGAVWTDDSAVRDQRWTFIRPWAPWPDDLLNAKPVTATLPDGPGAVVRVWALPAGPEAPRKGRGRR